MMMSSRFDIWSNLSQNLEPLIFSKRFDFLNYGMDSCGIIEMLKSTIAKWQNKAKILFLFLNFA